MALTILGLSGAVSHDPSAALYIDGKLVAAVEEERFVRDKHAKNRMPYESAKFCLEQAGIKPSDVDVVAIPFAPISLFVFFIQAAPASMLRTTVPLSRKAAPPLRSMKPAEYY